MIEVTRRDCLTIWHADQSDVLRSDVSLTKALLLTRQTRLPDVVVGVAEFANRNQVVQTIIVVIVIQVVYFTEVQAPCATEDTTVVAFFER